MLNNSALRIEWDDNDKRQIEEAKTHYRKARSEGRLIVDLEDKAIETFKPNLLAFIIKQKELNEDEFACRIFDETGDRRVIWDMLDPKQVKEAANLFNTYLDKGWRAYTVDDSGLTRRRIHKFDLENEEVVFEEKPITQIISDFVSAVKKEIKEIPLKKEKIEKFVKGFKDTKLVPRTYPG